MQFLDLPYDVRHHIYSHLFPPSNHLYLHSTEAGPIHLPTHDSTVPVDLLRTCPALHQEASEYLYNTYRLDVVGRKADCLKHYKSIQATVEKYARDEVHVRAFSNGRDSSTGCISILVGDGKLATLQRRQRGLPMTVEELESEEKSRLQFENFLRVHRRTDRDYGLMPAVVVGGVLALLLAWAVANFVL